MSGGGRGTGRRGHLQLVGQATPEGCEQCPWRARLADAEAENAELRALLSEIADLAVSPWA
jgi:hypothetical protein